MNSLLADKSLYTALYIWFKAVPPRATYNILGDKE